MTNFFCKCATKDNFAGSTKFPRYLFSIYANKSSHNNALLLRNVQSRYLNQWQRTFFRSKCGVIVYLHDNPTFTSFGGKLKLLVFAKFSGVCDIFCSAAVAKSDISIPAGGRWVCLFCPRQNTTFSQNKTSDTQTSQSDRLSALSQIHEKISSFSVPSTPEG